MGRSMSVEVKTDAEDSWLLAVQLSWKEQFQKGMTTSREVQNVWAKFYLHPNTHTDD